MKSLEENNSWASDGTYLAFRHFMAKIVPEFIEDGIDKKLKKIYIPICSTEAGCFVGENYLGKINYSEFMSYIYALNSFAGFRLPTFTNYLRDFSLPFDLKKLITEYYEDLQKEDYNIISDQNELVMLAFESFKNEILRDIFKDIVEGKYPVNEILDQDGVTLVSRIINLSLSVNNNELFINGKRFGKVNISEFIQFLISLECCCGQYSNNDSFELAFDLNGLFNYCYCNNNYSR